MTEVNSTFSMPPLGMETDLFKAADKLRGSLESTDYKYVILGLTFLTTGANRKAAPTHHGFGNGTIE